MLGHHLKSPRKRNLWALNGQRRRGGSVRVQVAVQISYSGVLRQLRCSVTTSPTKLTPGVSLAGLMWPAGTPLKIGPQVFAKRTRRFDPSPKCETCRWCVYFRRLRQGQCEIFVDSERIGPRVNDC